MDNSEELQPPDVITSDTENATNIQPKEAPKGKRKKFARFRAYNTDMWNGPKRENTEQFRRQDNLHRFDAISSTLELNDYQKRVGRDMLDGLDVRKLGHSVDMIIFGVCVVVANDDIPDGTRYWPSDNAQGNDSHFAMVGDDLGLTTKQQLRIVQKVKSRTDL